MRVIPLRRGDRREVQVRPGRSLDRGDRGWSRDQVQVEEEKDAYAERQRENDQPNDSHCVAAQPTTPLLDCALGYTTPGPMTSSAARARGTSGQLHDHDRAAPGAATLWSVATSARWDAYGLRAPAWETAQRSTSAARSARTS